MELSTWEIVEMEKASTAFSDFIKTLTNHRLPQNTVENLALTLIGEHRTHQQTIVKNLLRVLREYGELSHTDARNEVAVEYCKALPEILFPYI